MSTRKVNIGFLLMVAAALLSWGSSFSVIRFAGHHYSPGAMALLRFSVASLVMVGLVPWLKLRVPERRDWPGLFCLGLSGIAIYHYALNFGARTVTAGSTAFLSNTSPIFFVALAALVLREPIRQRHGTGMLICLIGVGMIASGEGNGLRGMLAPGALVVLIAALSAAIYMVLQRHYFARYSPFELTCYAIWSGALILSVFGAQLWKEFHQAPLPATLGICYTGIIPGALAYIVWALMVKRLPPAVGASLLYLVPPLSTAIAWLFLNESPGSLALSGGGVVLAGVAIVNWRR